MIYSFDEIMSEHQFHAPNEMAGYLLHGGLDKEGKYISPRTGMRWTAVNQWSENLTNQ